MILTLYGFLVFISLVLVVLGIIKPDESAQALTGFLFLFLLSLVLWNGNLEIETGSNISTTYGYDSADRVIQSNQSVVYDYENFSDETSQRVGMYFALASVIGFIGVIIGLKRFPLFGKGKKDE